MDTRMPGTIDFSPESPYRQKTSVKRIVFRRGYPFLFSAKGFAPMIPLDESRSSATACMSRRALIASSVATAAAIPVAERSLAHGSMQGEATPAASPVASSIDNDKLLDLSVRLVGGGTLAQDAVGGLGCVAGPRTGHRKDTRRPGGTSGIHSGITRRHLGRGTANSREYSPVLVSRTLRRRTRPAACRHLFQSRFMAGTSLCHPAHPLQELRLLGNRYPAVG